MAGWLVDVARSPVHLHGRRQRSLDRGDFDRHSDIAEFSAGPQRQLFAGIASSQQGNSWGVMSASAPGGNLFPGGAGRGMVMTDQVRSSFIPEI